MSNNFGYEVYVCKYEDDVLYVGQGKVGRSSHCNSGCSHVYGLNRLHFGKVNFTVEILSLHETQKEAVQEERRLIALHTPKFNKVNNDINSHYKLNNLLYLNSECNTHLKFVNCREAFDNSDFDEVDTITAQSWNYVENAKTLYFKELNGYYMVDIERNLTVCNYYNDRLTAYPELLFYTKSEVIMFCYKLFLFEDDVLHNKSWKRDKGGESETISLLIDVGCVIEYT